MPSNRDILQLYNGNGKEAGTCLPRLFDLDKISEAVNEYSGPKILFFGNTVYYVTSIINHKEPMLCVYSHQYKTSQLWIKMDDLRKFLKEKEVIK